MIPATAKPEGGMIDWQQVVFRLGKVRGSQSVLAEELGICRSVLADVSRGANKHPRDFGVCIRLLALYSEHVEPIPGALELAERVK